jgi:hypothetical protein
MEMNSNNNTQGNNNQSSKAKISVKEFFTLGEVFGYFFRKPDPNRPSNFNIKVMHGINKISILMFLVGLVFFLIKIFTR